jgi:hypothetical protein
MKRTIHIAMVRDWDAGYPRFFVSRSVDGLYDRLARYDLMSIDS